MIYRNRGPRCPHGMLIGLIDCPGCGKAKRQTATGAYYIRSTGGHGYRLKGARA